MPDVTVQMYRIPTAALIGTGTVQTQQTLTISDDDAILNNNNSADPGTDQVFTTGAQTAISSAVSFHYTFLWTPPGEITPVLVETIVMQLNFGAGGQYFMIAKEGNVIPDLGPGDTIVRVSLTSYTNDVPYTQLACFVTGTLIDTPDGPRRIEDIAIGDLVVTEDHGALPVRWAGSTRLDVTGLMSRPHLRPIRIRAGALGAGVPARDLLLSPQHRVLLTGWRVELFFGEDEVLVPVKQLLSWPGVEIVDDAPGVGYHHIMFDAHEVVRANGMPAESFYLGDQIKDGIEREQADEILTLFPDLAKRAPDPARPFSKVFEVAAAAPV